MTSIPASRRARAMILAPRSWPSRPGLATTTRIFFCAVGADIVEGRPAGGRGGGDSKATKNEGARRSGPLEGASRVVAGLTDDLERHLHARRVDGADDL